jgi:D-amino-acid dehydrogenase
VSVAVPKHVAVVGAGVIGLCTALYCIQRGWRVTLIERNGERRDGCSFGNTGMIVPSHFVPLAAPGMLARCLKWMCNPASPLYIKPRASWDLLSWGVRFWKACSEDHVRRAAPLLRDLHLASRTCYEELERLSDGFGMTRNGALMLCRSQHALAEEVRTASEARVLGIPAEVLDRDQTAALDPGMQMDVRGAVHFPLDGHLVPDRMVGALQRQVAAQGAECKWNTAVTGWQIDGGAKIRAAECAGNMLVAADEFVLAAGSWSAALVRSLGIDIPMQAGKGYSLTLAKPRALPRMCAILTEARVAVSPMAGALRIGGTMEMAGLDEGVNGLRVRTMIDAVTRYYPGLAAADFDGVAPWCGLRPCTPDGLPYLGRSARYSNLTIATGHAMMGVSLGPITGKITAQLLASERPAYDMALLSPDRYNA